MICLQGIHTNNMLLFTRCLTWVQKDTDIYQSLPHIKHAVYHIGSVDSHTFNVN